MMEPQQHVWVVPPAPFHRTTGDARWFEGSLIDILCSAEDTNGSFAVVRARFTPRMWEPPLHYHNDTDELWYVTEGTILFRVGEETFEASAGTFVCGPRGFPHSFMFDEEAEMLIFVFPGGAEQLFVLLDLDICNGDDASPGRRAGAGPRRDGRAARGIRRDRYRPDPTDPSGRRRQLRPETPARRPKPIAAGGVVVGSDGHEVGGGRYAR